MPRSPPLPAQRKNSLKDVHAILDAHYLNRDPALAESAIRKARIENKNSQLTSQPA
jgi:hypothetical protein